MSRFWDKFKDEIRIGAGWPVCYKFSIDNVVATPEQKPLKAECTEEELTDLATILAEEICKEIDREVIRTIYMDSDPDFI